MAGETIISHDFTGLNNGDLWPANRYQWRGTTGVTRDVQSQKGRTSSPAGAAYPGGYHTLLDTSVLLDPVDVTVTAPDTATFTADIGGVNTFRWQIMFTDGRVADIGEVGADTKTFTTTSRDVQRDNGKMYRLSAWHSASPTLKRYTRWALLTVVAPVTVGTPLKSVDFSSFPLTSFGTPLKTQLASAFGATIPWEDNSVQVIEANGNRMLRHKSTPSGSRTQYPVYFTGGPSHGGGYEELYLSFRVFVEDGFHHGTSHNGGKMVGGLCGGKIAGASYPPSGGIGADGTDGFSSRLNWGGGSNMTAKIWVSYDYHVDRTNYNSTKTRNYGDAIPFKQSIGSTTNFSWATGRWFLLTQRIKMNTAADKYDGVSEWWVDGIKRHSRTNLRWRTTGKFSIDCFYISNFHGGGSSSYPAHDSFWRFDDIKIATSPEGVDGIVGTAPAWPNVAAFGQTGGTDYRAFDPPAYEKTMPNPATHTKPLSVGHFVADAYGNTFKSGVSDGVTYGPPWKSNDKIPYGLPNGWGSRLGTQPGQWNTWADGNATTLWNEIYWTEEAAGQVNTNQPWLGKAYSNVKWEMRWQSIWAWKNDAWVQLEGSNYTWEGKYVYPTYGSGWGVVGGGENAIPLTGSAVTVLDSTTGWSQVPVMPKDRIAHMWTKKYPRNALDTGMTKLAAICWMRLTGSDLGTDRPIVGRIGLDNYSSTGDSGQYRPAWVVSRFKLLTPQWQPFAVMISPPTKPPANDPTFDAYTDLRGVTTLPGVARLGETWS